MRTFVVLAALVWAVWGCDDCPECQASQGMCVYPTDWLKAYETGQFDPLWMQTARTVNLYDSRGVCVVAFRVPSSSNVTNVKFVHKSPGFLPIEASATCDEYFSFDSSTPSGLACEAVVPECIQDPIGLEASIWGSAGKLATVEFERSPKEGPGELIDFGSLKSYSAPVCGPKVDPDVSTQGFAVYLGPAAIPMVPSPNADKNALAALPSGWLWMRRNGQLACVGTLDCILTFDYDSSKFQYSVHDEIGDQQIQIRWRGVAGELIEFGDVVVTRNYPLEVVSVSTENSGDVVGDSLSDVVNVSTEGSGDVMDDVGGTEQ